MDAMACVALLHHRTGERVDEHLNFFLSFYFIYPRRYEMHVRHVTSNA
jgi:hypothetical protein